MNKIKESKSFNIGDSKDLEDALDFVNKDEDEETIEQVIDLDAETEEDLSPTYVGKVLGQCTTCHSLIYMEPDSLVKAEDVDSDTDEDIYNVDEECVICGATDGYVLLGKVVPINDKEVDKVDEPKEDETEDDGADNKKPEGEEPKGEEDKDDEKESDEDKEKNSIKEELEESTITEVAGGMSKGLSVEDIASKHGVEDIKEIKLGVEVEQEHTSDVEEAKKIAMDHLTEFPDYYDRLNKMEKEC